MGDERKDEEVRRVRDLMIHGIHITRNGKRIDPDDFYISKEEWEGRHALSDRAGE